MDKILPDPISVNPGNCGSSKVVFMVMLVLEPFMADRQNCDVFSRVPHIFPKKEACPIMFWETLTAALEAINQNPKPKTLNPKPVNPT